MDVLNYGRRSFNGFGELGDQPIGEGSSMPSGLSSDSGTPSGSSTPPAPSSSGGRERPSTSGTTTPLLVTENIRPPATQKDNSGYIAGSEAGYGGGYGGGSEKSAEDSNGGGGDAKQKKKGRFSLFELILFAVIIYIVYKNFKKQ